ncbi:unnamed protein product [Rotaria sp. Silwood2]|nr:unnamed protein product [Rotaria sp. Silwood2]CAF2482720.1 unnamed protein product [Rotaria sp. Silwood2]CAF4338600.1 unnamed protein product [Rotaria sp. Silwood2]
MAGTQMIKVTLQRDSLQTPWGFRLQGGADFCMPFTVNKITAGSPADGILHRGDIILDIDQKPISSMPHADALELVQRAGGQITFLIERGSTPLGSFMHNQRPMSAMPWSLVNAASYIDRNFRLPWPASVAPQSPTAFFRSRALERIPDPKPLLSQTGSPLMPGPVPSVSTKTRGYTKPPVFHTEPTHLSNTSPLPASYSPVRFTYPSSTNNGNYQTVSPTPYQAPWKDSVGHESRRYVPSYQKKVPVNTIIQKQNPNNQKQQRTHQQYTTIARQQQQHYRPASVQPINLVNRQYNSPMSLYSNGNVQDVMKDHVSHITRVSIVPSMPKQSHGNYVIGVSPSHDTYTTASTPICYVKPKQSVYASDF